MKIASLRLTHQELYFISLYTIGNELKKKSEKQMESEKSAIDIVLVA